MERFISDMSSAGMIASFFLAILLGSLLFFFIGVVCLVVSLILN